MTETRPTAIPDDFVVDLYSPDFAENPYPVYEWLRETAPCYHQPAMNIYILSRYEDVWRAHRDAATYSSKAGPTIERVESNGLILLAKDAPDHGWAKAMMTKVFSRERMASLDGFIRSKAEELLETAYAKYGPEGEFDMVSEFAVPLPLAVISELLGIPDELREKVHHLSNIFISRAASLTPEEQQRAQGDLFGLFYGLTLERRQNPRDDPVSMLIAIEVEDEQGVKHKLSNEEIAMRFLEMGFAGHETVAKAIPNGAMAMERFPDQKSKVAADLSRMPDVVQEILRFDPPSQLQGRVTTKEVMIHSVTIPADSRVMLATGGATRDPRAFADPDVFNIERDLDSRTIAFGYGVHKCLGIHLAQREIAIAFEELFSRFPGWKVFGDRTTRAVLSNVRGVASLPMVLGEHA